MGLITRNHAAPEPAGSLRTVSPPLPPAAPAAPVGVVASPFRAESFELTATRQGVHVVQLRAEERGSSYLVECVVHPVGAPTTTHRPGPYALADRKEALAFLQEAERALVYLGCRIEHSLVEAGSGHLEGASDRRVERVEAELLVERPVHVRGGEGGGGVALSQSLRLAPTAV